MMQKVLKDMVIIAELWPQAFAALQTVKFHYKVARFVFNCAAAETLSPIVYTASFA